MEPKNLYAGKLIVDIVTVVENDTEKIMTKQAHENLDGELFDEIRALLGAKGYISQSIGATLEDQGDVCERNLEVYESNVAEATRRANGIYNKVNEIVIDMS